MNFREHALFHHPHELVLSHSHQNYGRHVLEEPKNNIGNEDALGEEDALSEDAIMQDVTSTYFDLKQVPSYYMKGKQITPCHHSLDLKLATYG